MTFGQFLSILRARKWAALAVFAIVVAGTVAASLLMPSKYTAASSIVVDVKPDPVSNLAYPLAALQGFIATQVDIITSERVAQRVIRDTKLADNPQIREQWTQATQGKGTIEQWLTPLLLKQLDVKPSRESNVIQVVYQSPDPRFAAGLVNAFVQAYIATTLELRTDPARLFTTFFNARSKEARDALERAQGRLSAFQQDKGIIANDERIDVETARLNELSSQLVQLQAIASESSSRQAQARGGSGDRLQEVLNNPLIGGLRADLSRSEGKLKELTSRLGDNHPQVVEARASIAELRNRIELETRRVTGGVGITNTINRQREAEVRRGLEEQRAKVLRMKAVRDEGQVLMRDVENAQRNYDAIVARLTQTSMESQSTQSYANVLSVAQPPVEPSSPKLLLNTLIALFVGLLLAVGTALLLELRDRRVRAPADLVESLGLPVLGVLGRPGDKRYAAGGRMLLLQHQRLAGEAAGGRS